MNKIVNAVAAAIVAFVAVTWAAQQGPQASVSNQSIGLWSESSRFSADFDDITIPRMLNFQGTLRDSTGRVVPDTTYSVRFGLYEQASGGSPFWWETQTVRTKTGVFSVLLGSAQRIGPVPDDGSLYLGMKIESDSEMTPRAQIVSAAYALKADTAAYARRSGGTAAYRTATDAVGTSALDWDDMPNTHLLFSTDSSMLYLTFAVPGMRGGTKGDRPVEGPWLRLLLDGVAISTVESPVISCMLAVPRGEHSAKIQWRSPGGYYIYIPSGLTRTLTAIEY